MLVLKNLGVGLHVGDGAIGVASPGWPVQRWTGGDNVRRRRRLLGVR